MDRMMDFTLNNLWLSQVASVIAGLFFLHENALIGLALIVLGIMSIAISISRVPWSELSIQQRSAVVPSTVLGFVAVVAVAMFIAAFLIAARDIFD
jgi:uncharacterized membrane protein YidH (DUF202 family)